MSEDDKIITKDYGVLCYKNTSRCIDGTFLCECSDCINEYQKKRPHEEWKK